MKATKLLVSVAGAALLAFGWSETTRAAQFTLDFETAPDGSALDPYAIDTHGDGDRVDVGSIWSSVGIDITALDTDAPLGLFNSNCKPNGGVSDNGFTAPCNTSNSAGDPDLATGGGSYVLDGDTITYNTEPQGNLLILEENPGDGIPDDMVRGGTISFDLNEKIVLDAVLQEFVFVDNVSGSIELFFTDGTSALTNFDVANENDLFVLTAPSDKSLASFDVNFDGSGGIGAVVFSEYQAVPEGETLFGMVVAGGLLGALKLRQRFALKQLDARADD